MRAPIALLISVIAGATPWGQAPAGTLPATPTTPDLLGIYPGMPMMAARAQLQRHSNQFQVTTNSDPASGFGMLSTDGNNREQITVNLTRAPNEPAVWLIQRSQVFNNTDPMSIAALLSALHEKYGKETLTLDRGGGGLYLFWIFDANGRLRSSADPGLTGCSGSSFINDMVQGLPPSLNTIEQACVRSFFALTAMLNRHDAQMLEAYTVELVNLPYAASAAANIRDLKNAAAAQARRELLERADQKKPSF